MYPLSTRSIPITDVILLLGLIVEVVAKSTNCSCLCSRFIIIVARRRVGLVSGIHSCSAIGEREEEGIRDECVLFFFCLSLFVSTKMGCWFVPSTIHPSLRLKASAKQAALCLVDICGVRFTYCSHFSTVANYIFLLCLKASQ